MNPLIKMQDSVTFTFTILLIICHLYSEGQFNEDFSDNDLLTNPQWIGNLDKFIIEEDKLRSNSTITSDEFYIITPSGYATPGYQNSQYIQTPKTTHQFELNSSIISPDGDGFEDFLVLKYQMNNLGYILNGYIYNLAGFQVHQPFNNVLLSSDGNLKWDGLDSNGIKLPIGNYILLIEAFNETGKIIKRKIAFGITGIF